MRALVTGATGFLGGRLASMLLDRGAEVAVLARRPEAMEPGLRARVRVIAGGLGDEAALQDAVRGATHVFHCAAAATDWASAEVFRESNVLGTERLLRAAGQSAALKRFVHVSTTDVYGYPAAVGDERLPMVDRGLGYNQTKIGAERAVWAAHAAGMPVTVVRPATIYGAARGGGPADGSSGESSGAGVDARYGTAVGSVGGVRAVPLVTGVVDELRRGTMLLVDGGRVRAGLVYVDDVAEAMIGVCGVEATVGRVYNLAAGSDVTWGEYAGGLARGMGLREPWLRLPFAGAMALAGACELPYRIPGMPGRPLLTRHAVWLLGRDQEFGSERARAEFGWEPRVGFAEGMARTVRWVRSLG